MEWFNKKTKPKDKTNWELEFDKLYSLYLRLEHSFYGLKEINERLCELLENGNRKNP